MKYLNIGGCSIDTLIHVHSIPKITDDLTLFADKVFTSVGGTGAGKALALAYLGVQQDFITELGPDQYGDQLRCFFKDKNLTFYPTPSDVSTAHTNIMHDNGKRISIFTSHIQKCPPIHENAHDIISSSDVVFLNINEFCRQYIPLLKECEVPIVVDIHDYEPPNPYHQDFIKIADILIASSVYIKDHNSFMEQYIDQGKQIVVITKGSEGLVAMDASKQVVQLPGYNEWEYVDSNGAGDSFCSGFVVEYMETKDLLQALKVGTVCGGIACTSEELYHKDYPLERIRNIVKTIQWDLK
jgi:sugar/nucleoside kinase (ribokinase family)